MESKNEEITKTKKNIEELETQKRTEADVLMSFKNEIIEKGEKNQEIVYEKQGFKKTPQLHGDNVSIYEEE